MQEPSEFGTLTSLIHLIQTINGPSAPAISTYDRWQVGSRHLNYDVTLLDALVAILVQRHELVAASHISVDSINIVISPTGEIQESELDIDSSADTVPALSNPDADSGQTPTLTLSPRRQGVWNHIRDTCDWYCAFTGPLSVSEHMATVSAYLEDYRRTEDESTRHDYGCRFSSYLFTTCWTKMHRRITSWQALGVIHYLDKRPSVGDFYHPSKTGPGDNAFVFTLKYVLENESAKKALSFSDDQWAALRKVAEQQEEPPFSQKTAKEFGELVAAVFKGFASCLIELSVEHEKLDKSSERTFLRTDDRSSMTLQQQRVLEIFENLVFRTRLLHSLAFSASFSNYLSVLERLMNIPRRAAIPLYLQFKQNSLLPNHIPDPTESTAADAGDEKSAEMEQDSMQDQEAVKNARIVEEDVYLFNFEKTGYFSDDKNALLAFIKTFVLHFTSRRILQNYWCRSPPIPINVTLLSVGHSRLSLPTSSWPIMQGLIKASLSSREADIAIEILKEKVSALQSGQSSSMDNSIFSTFRPLIEQNPEQDEAQFTGGLHCEAALMTISRYLQDFLHDDDLISVCTTLLKSRDKISVSTLCCPVCSYLLSTLNGHLPPAHGFHTAVRPMELPKWVTTHQGNEITRQLGLRLRAELLNMLQSAQSLDGDDDESSIDNSHWF